MHPMSRGVARIAAITAVTVSSGALVAVPPAVADIGADLKFVCAGGSGTHEVALRVETSVPTSGAVGEPVQPGTVRVDVGIPEELVHEAIGESPGEAPTPPVTGVEPSPAIAGMAQLRVAVQDTGRMRGGGWPAFALAATPSREDGTVHLTGSGVAPPVVPLSPGGLSWVAGRLELSLMRDDAVTSPDEAELALRCTAEKETVLGTVRVRPGDRAPAPGAPGELARQAAAFQEDACEELPGPGIDPRYGFNNDPALRKIYDTPGLPDGMQLIAEDGVPMCIKGAGFFNVKKAGNAIPIATETLLRRSVETYTPIDGFFGPNYFEDRGYALNKTAPVPGTVLGFGFMPTRAVAEAVQVRAPGAGQDAPVTGNYQFASLANPLSPANYIKETGIDVATYVRVEAGKASVNGVPLALGDNCATSPALLSARSFMGTQETGLLQPEPGQTIIAEDVEIPAFTGCGVTEDLSPILTASVSGTGNYANIESGQWCNFEDKSGCVDGAAAQPETFTIRPGGEVTATAESFTLTSLFGGQFACESAKMRFPLKQAHWQARYMLTKASMSLAGCEARDSNGAVHPVKDVTAGSVYVSLVRVQQDGSMSFSVNDVHIKSSTEMDGNRCTLEFANSAFDFSTFGYVELPGYFEASYDNGTGVLSATSSTGITLSPKSTCTTMPGFIVGVPLAEMTGNFALRPRQNITTP